MNKNPELHKTVGEKIVHELVKAVGFIRHPLLTLFGVLGIVLLIGLVASLIKGDLPSYLGFPLLTVGLLIVAILAAVIWARETDRKYAKQKEALLKETVRELVLEKQEGKALQRQPSPVQILHVEYDALGPDAQGEFVRIKNFSETVIDLTDWTLQDKTGHSFVFPSHSLKPGGYVRIWTAQGTNTATDLYWGRNQAVWNNEGDHVYLRDNEGVLVAFYCCS